MGFLSNVFEYGWTAGSIITQGERDAERICKNIKTTIIDEDDENFDPNGCKIIKHSLGDDKVANTDAGSEKNVESISDDLKMKKFRKMIEDIKNAIVPIGRSSVLSSIPDETYYLALIYDYNVLNDYGKFIMRQCNKDADSLCQLYEDGKRKQDVAWKFIDEENEIVSRKFIFWAMLILTVDSTNKEEHLSLICDFAKVLKIDDEEMLDIAKVIQVINDSAEERIFFHSKTIPSYFRHVFGNYEYGSEVEHYQSYYNSDISYIAEEEIKVWEKYD